MRDKTDMTPGFLLARLWVVTAILEKGNTGGGTGQEGRKLQL